MVDMLGPIEIVHTPDTKCIEGCISLNLLLVIWVVGLTHPLNEKIKLNEIIFFMKLLLLIMTKT
ncbi:hypothetical protein B9X78_05645 [Acinetobacter pittii]|nr:hypothetical protein [Acinetobacter pittii]OTL23933.1 hypothetical protein B9X78_05645 [Acinetobacter pittii]